MPILLERIIAELLRPYLVSAGAFSPDLYSYLSIYLDLLIKWNARTNLTAVRDPEEIVRRHFGESLFAAQHLGSCATLLDFGSGAGFPGLPIALFRPEVAVTLAESQNKKATFLREVVRSLGIKTEVWPFRVEAMPGGRTFHTVTLRAVDNMGDAIAAACPYASHQLLILASLSHPFVFPPGFQLQEKISIPGSTNTLLLRVIRSNELP